MSSRRASLQPGLLVAASLLLVTSASARAELTVIDAWVAQPPPVAVPAAGYVTFENTGSAQEVVIAIDSPDFARVELHRSEVVDGVASMSAVGSLKVPAGQVVPMAPGGLHLMLFDGTRRLQPGDAVALTFVTAAGDELNVEATVRKAGANEGASGAAHAHGDHQMDGHGHAGHSH